MATPDWSAFLASVWPDSIESPDVSAIIAVASNVVVGQNPPYTIQDFFSIYPKFAGPVLLSGASAPQGSFTAGSPNFTVNNAAGLVIGQPIAGTPIPDNTFISAISGTNISMTNPATQTLANVPIVVWNATLVPVPVLLMFISLASASLVQARWLDSWTFAMGLFVAHFATLWAKSDGNPVSTAGQVAAQGLAGGVQVSKSVGDVQVSYQPVEGIETWGAWNLTSYGQQLATMGRVIGMGPLFLY